MASYRGGSKMGLLGRLHPCHSAWMVQRALGFRPKVTDSMDGLMYEGRWNDLFFLI